MARSTDWDQKVQATLASQGKDLERLARNQELVMLGLFIMLGSMFMTAGGLVMDWLAQKHSSYEQLGDSILRLETEFRNLERPSCSLKG